jgi:SRSO17 transposase
LVRVGERRWQIEEGFAQAKGEVGPGQYEARTWNAWRRHATLRLPAVPAPVCHRPVATRP